MTQDCDYLLRGLEAFRDRDFATAVDDLEKATMDDPEDFQAFHYLGAAYAGVGRHNEAIGALMKAADLQPTDPRVHYNLGQAYEAADVPSEAFYQYQKSLEIDPCYPYARTALTALKARMAAERGHNIRFAA